MGPVSRRVGIEKLRVYPGSLALSMADLCEARGHDIGDIRDDMMVDERSLNVPWEDPVTMAVNAAKPMLSEADRAKIGLVIVASESGVDQEKPLEHLGPALCRFAVKRAQHRGQACLLRRHRLVATGGKLDRIGGRRRRAALVINTDESRMHLGAPWEFVLGAGATALLISDNPRVLEIELGSSGIYTYEISDLTRPTSRVETGNSETSSTFISGRAGGSIGRFSAPSSGRRRLGCIFQADHLSLAIRWHGLSRAQSDAAAAWITGKMRRGKVSRGKRSPRCISSGAWAERTAPALSLP